MAHRGYLDAHRLTFEEITRMFGKERALLQDIHAELFKPTIDAGLLTNAMLRRYRTTAVFIRASRYVSPNHERLDELMQRSVKALERAQCDSDFAPLIELLSRYFTQSDGLSTAAGLS